MGPVSIAHFAAVLFDCRELLSDGFVDLFPGGGLRSNQWLPQTFRVVQTEDHAVGQCAETAAGERMIGISFELDRPAITHLHERAARRAATATNRSKPTRHTGSEFNWLLQIRNDLLLGRATTTQRQRRRRVAQHLEKCASRHSGNRDSLPTGQPACHPALEISAKVSVLYSSLMLITQFFSDGTPNNPSRPLVSWA